MGNGAAASNMAVSLVASKRGVTLLPAFARHFLPASVVARPLAGEVPTIDLVIGYNKANTSPVLDLFLSRIDGLIARVAEKAPAPVAGQARWTAFPSEGNSMKSPLAAIAGLALAASTRPGFAAAASGHGALALGALVGSYSTILTARDKAVLDRLLDGKPAGAPARPITIKADAVVCHAGNVDIAAFGCDLTFGAKQVRLTGRHANELFATIIEAGVPPDGAAGTIYEALHALNCVIDTAGIALQDGGGANCTFEPGPP